MEGDERRRWREVEGDESRRWREVIGVGGGKREG